MSERVVLQMGDPKLKAKNKIVAGAKNPHIKNVIQDLIDTMRTNGLVGIAAPQIGENYHVFVTEPRNTKTRAKYQTDELRVYINPTITHYSKAQSIIYEGCGSVMHGDLFAPVKRPKQITVEAYDRNMKKFRLVCDGLLARVIQHEYDHLSGVEFTEKIYDYKKIMCREFYMKGIKKSRVQMVASEITVKRFSEI
jgi:peptide deformylase